MKRVQCAPRENWQQKVESTGLVWHSSRGDYWNESAYYSFTMDEILKIEKATNDLHQMCLKAVQHVIDNKLYSKLHIPDAAIPIIEATWNQEPPSLFGRFDLAYSGLGDPKMLEYNADTPTSLVEAALTQWFWLQDVHPQNDQFNSLHERLIACWQDFKNYLQGDILHFTSIDDIEDGMTIQYLQDTANQAGLKTKLFTIDKIGLTENGYFVDSDDEPIMSCFKLYPWEWLVHEEYGQRMLEIGAELQWIEPAWKMVLSNKGILPILWQLFPDHPNLLPASFEEVDTVMWEAYVKKPILSREGAGVTVSMFDQTLQKSNDAGYGEEGYIYQGLATLPQLDKKHPVLGSWIIGQEAGGMGIREDSTLITGNLSQFVPHLIEG